MMNWDRFFDVIAIISGALSALLLVKSYWDFADGELKQEGLGLFGCLVWLIICIAYLFAS